MNCFFDMDGVLGVYERDAYVPPAFKWKTLGQHYFLHVKPDEKAVKLFELLSDTPGINTFILTAVLNNGPICLEQINDKIQWTREHVRNVDISKQFIPTVSNKTRTIQAMLFQNENHLSPSDVLLDDYNPNLKAWQDAGGTAIKYLNGLNNGSTFKGIVLPQNMPAEQIAELLNTLNKTALFEKH